MVRDVIGSYGGIHAFAKHFGLTPRSVYRYMRWGFFSKEVALRIELDTGGDYEARYLIDPKYLEDGDE